MASEYLKWKYRDVQPDEPIRLTPAQKRANWWHYHKWTVLLGLVLLGIGASLLKSALHIGEVLPDYQLAYVASSPLPQDTASALEAALAPFGEDRNGDGQVRVQVVQYVLGEALASQADTAAYAQASQVRLMADLEGAESGLFLLEDCETFQSQYDILLPPEGSGEGEAPGLLWQNCPVLSGLSLGGYAEEIAGESVTGDSQQFLSGLSLARREFWQEKQRPLAEAYQAFWETLTKGAET